MTGLDDMTGAPTAIGGLTLHPLDLVEIGKFERWAKQRLLSDAVKACEGAVEEDKKLFIAAAMEMWPKMSFMENHGRSMLNSAEGMAIIIWLSVSTGDPKAIEADVLGKIGSFADASDKFIEISRMSGWSLAGSSKEAEKPPPGEEAAGDQGTG